jgi:hypothetical protein
MNFTTSAATALELLPKFGQYQFSNKICSHDEMASAEDSNSVAPAYNAAFDAEEVVKKRAACDECSMYYYLNMN